MNEGHVHVWVVDAGGIRRDVVGDIPEEADDDGVSRGGFKESIILVVQPIWTW